MPDDGGIDVFFHERSVDGDKPVADDRVEFVEGRRAPKGRTADSVRVIG
ncbi:MAG: hypothetical protein WAK55_00830 [Xanthobacteraceae bacterium]